MMQIVVDDRILRTGNNIEIKQTKDEIIVLEVSKKIIQRIPK